MVDCKPSGPEPGQSLPIKVPKYTTRGKTVITKRAVVQDSCCTASFLERVFAASSIEFARLLHLLEFARQVVGQRTHNFIDLILGHESFRHVKFGRMIAPLTCAEPLRVPKYCLIPMVKVHNIFIFQIGLSMFISTGLEGML